MARIVAEINTEGEIDWSNYDWEAVDKTREESRKILSEQYKQECESHCEYVGEIIYFGVADGRAEYMVKRASPLELVHFTDMDGYKAHPALIRGLNLDDVKYQVDGARRMTELLRKKD
jgi:hypothetical protein